MPLVPRALLLLAVTYILFFHGLDAAGLFGPDEPRYASIGRAMAQSGDWITPRLWGEPWFEKPPLIFWLTAIAWKLGLSADLAPRLPVALLSVLFLIAYYLLLREPLGETAARFATAILATSAGWLADSHVAVPDIPMSVCFALGMLLAARGSFWISGVCFGLAILAKSLVPIVLATPLLWHWRKRILSMWPIAAGALAVAAPWYVLCAWRNGEPFFTELIMRQQINRFFTPERQHVQPIWWYVPVIMAGLFPWTPALVLLRSPGSNEFLRWLWLWLGFGFVFFSAATNKLPGYLLPLLPAAAALLGDALAKHAKVRAVLAITAALLGLIPAILPALPQAIETGSGGALDLVRWSAAILPVMAILIATWFLAARQDRQVVMAVIVVLTSLCAWRIAGETLPALDARVSARSVWRTIEPRAAEVCLDDPHRRFRYGMNYYSGTPLPDCAVDPRPIRITQ